jgi:hypothetical protein
MSRSLKKRETAVSKALTTLGLRRQVAQLQEDKGNLAEEAGRLSGLLEQVPRPVLEALALCAKKAGDYNKHTGRDAYFPLGLPSYAQMIHTKAMRLVNLAASGRAPNFESVRDTCLDLVNYAWFLADAVDRGEVK